MSKIFVLYAGGGGCSWLCHTVGCLENNKLDIVDVQASGKFDFVDMRSSIISCHHWELESEDISPYYVFSTKYMFNICIAGHKKNIHILDDLTLQEKFEQHTNNALYQMSSDHLYATAYLEHEWLYNSPDKFIDTLFDLLDSHEFVYTKDREFMHKSIENYILTNPSPNKYYDNYNSLMWLGWCHAVVTQSNRNVETDLSKCQTITEIANALYPFRDICLSEIKKFIIPGTLNE